MYGPDLLVAPVVVAGATSREVYLPTVVIEAPLAVIPVLARDGSHGDLVGRI